VVNTLLTTGEQVPVTNGMSYYNAFDDTFEFMTDNPPTGAEGSAWRGWKFKI